MIRHSRERLSQLTRWTGALGATVAGIPRRHAARRRETGRFGRILRYHRVIPPGEAPGYYRLGIPVALFEAQMRWLAAHHHVVSLDEFLGLARSGSRPRKDVVVITFDDGYKDNATHAAPILSALGLPATFYVVSSGIREHAPFWQESLAQMIRMTARTSLDVDIDSRRIPFPLHSSEERKKACMAMIRLLRTRPRDEIESAMERIARALAVSPDDARRACPPMLTAADLRGMARSGFHIASHTATHPYLPAEDEARQRREIETSRRDLEELLGQPVIDFCFPAGGYTTRICELVRDAGYRSAVTTDLGIAGSDDDPWRIPRIGVGTALATDPWGRFSGAMFETETSGYFADLYRRRLGARRE